MQAIRLASGEQAYSAVLTVMNEWVQVVAQFVVADKSLDTVRDQLIALMNNYDKLGLQV
jgi:hypothetical protein